MRTFRVLSLCALAGALSTGCAALERMTADEAPERQPSSENVAEAATLDLTCDQPAFLVRDLTVAWQRRAYLVGPCDGGERHRAVTRAVHVPGGAQQPRHNAGDEAQPAPRRRSPPPSPTTPVAAPEAAGEEARR